MPIGLYMDEHIPQAITDQLRRRGIDVLTALEDGFGHRPDPAVLDRAQQLHRVVFTHDHRFRAYAEDLQRRRQSFGGLVFGEAQGGTLGDFIRDLELIALASDLEDWLGVVQRIPYR